MADKTELLPCPHCGTSAGIITHANAYQVICGDRKCSVYKYHEKKEDATKAWNTRSTPYPVTKAEAVDLLDAVKWNYVQRSRQADSTQIKCENVIGKDKFDKLRRLLEAAAQQGE